MRSFFVLIILQLVCGCGDSEEFCCGACGAIPQSEIKSNQPNDNLEGSEKPEVNEKEPNSDWYSWENTSIETVGVETLSEFQTIIKFIRYNTWRVARGEGKVQISGRGTYSASHMRGVNFLFGSSKAMTSGRSPTFNTDHGFKIKKIIEAPADAPANYILKVYFNYNDEILTIFNNSMELTWGDSLLTMRPK